MNPDEKACPFCAETIKAEAIFCRHCKSSLTAPAARPRIAVGAPPRQSGLPGWAIALIVVFAVIPFLAIVAAIAIPGIIAANTVHGERSASASLRTLATAEADFRSNDRDDNQVNDFWVADVRGLYTGAAATNKNGPIKLIEISIAAADSAPSPASWPLDDPKLAAPKMGYHFQVITLDETGTAYGSGGNNGPDAYHNFGKFGMCAYPAKYRTGCKLTFIINEVSTIFKRDIPGGGSVTAFPNDSALSASWRKMD